MKTALICPPHLLEKYASQTKYHLALPHLFRLEKYQEFYQTKSDDGDFVILDNGAAEGFAYGAKHILTLADLINADEVVVPDAMGDANETLALAQYFARYAKPDHQYMFVIQGTTMEEVLFCLRALDNGNSFMYVTTLGIPRHLYYIEPTARAQITEWLIRENFHLRYDIHFLGANPWMDEPTVLNDLTTGLEGFRGMDTSLPIYMGLEGRRIDVADQYMQRPEDFFTRTDDNPMVQVNINKYLSWFE